MTGIDKPIDRLLTLFNARLWPTALNKQFNGRISRNIVNGDLLAQKYLSGNEYQTIMFDDRLNALCFFDCDTDEDFIDGNMFSQNVRLVFAVNLSVLYPTITTYRPTPEAHEAVLSIIKRDTRTFEILGIDSGLNAYGNLSTDKLKRYDMHPYHTFAVRLKINYDYTLC